MKEFERWLKLVDACLRRQGETLDEVQVSVSSDKIAETFLSRLGPERAANVFLSLHATKEP